jgi:hypothetical protein
MINTLHLASSLFISLLLVTTTFAADIVVSENDLPGAPRVVRTPALAIEAVRELRKSNPDRQQPIVVQIDGTHRLPAPLVLTPEDAGTPKSPTIFTGGILSGGVRITGWKDNGDGSWSVPLPEVQKGNWTFTQLFVNGQRRYRPRLPKTGYYHVADKLDPTEKNQKKGFDRFKFAADNINPNWTNLGDVEVLGFQVWTMARLRIEKVDDKEKTVTFTGPTRGLAHYSALLKGGRYIVENVKEALKQPGEWYLDRKTGLLAYIPLPGEDMTKVEVIAPRIDSLLELKGDFEAKKWVSNVHFKNVTFAHTNWVTPPEGNAYPQAEVNLGGAISAVGARDCLFENCTVRNIGTYAFDFAAACKNNRVEGCELTDTGAGGVKLGLTRFEIDDSLITSHQTIRDNLIAHGGRLHPAAVGVWIGHSPHNTVEHNEIFDIYYTGVSVGWSWGYDPAGAHHNTIAWNHIHQIGQGVLSDMGGIYTLGLSPSSTLHHNHIHDVHAFDYGGWGIYYDEGTTGMVGEHNVVHRTKTGGFHQHYGKENVVRNNIFAFALRDQVQRTRPEPHLSFTFERNIVYWDKGPLLGSNWSDDKYKLDHNLYWRTDRQPIDFKGMSLDQWRAKGQDVHSIIADPQFVDPHKGDFRLKLDSPASQIGYVAWDVANAGRLNGKSKDPKLAPPAFPVQPRP